MNDGLREIETAAAAAATLSGASTRGHSFKLHCPDSRVNIRAHFFAVHVIPVWNRLPPLIVAAKTYVQALNSLNTEFFSSFSVLFSLPVVSLV